MKKFIALLLVFAIAISLFSMINVAAANEKEIIIPESNSTFESGTTSWGVLSGGKVEIVNNPAGKGKVLAYKNNPKKSFASPVLDIKPYIGGKFSKAGTITITFDFYSTLDTANCVIRIRTEEGGLSLCGNKTFCEIGRIKAEKNTWVNVSAVMELQSLDFESAAEYWNLCFDGLYSSGDEAPIVYLDNFKITYTESPFADMDTSEEVQEGNLLQANNSTFESADKYTWTAFSLGKVSIAKNPVGEDRVLMYSDCPNPENTENNNNWASPMLNIKPLIFNKIEDTSTVYVAMDVYTEGESGPSVLALRTSDEEELAFTDGKKYASIGSIAFTKDKWVRVYGEFEVRDDDLEYTEGYWNLCFNNLCKVANEQPIYIDNVYIGFEKETEETRITHEIKVDNLPIPEKTPIERGEKTLVGTIRWDAYSKSTPGGVNPSSQVAKVLSPKEHHWQAPFFACVEEDDTISFPEYTVETWEKEAEYAKKAGIDYFAYVWYETGELTAQARQYHIQSDKKDIIKMAGVLEKVYSEPTMNELFDAMKDNCYVKLSGRPVLFLYGVDDWTKAEVETVRQLAANAGIDKALYIVGMTRSKTRLYENLSKGIDGTSWYGVGAQATNEPFSNVSQRCMDLVNSFGDQSIAFNYGFIPAFTTGTYTLARIKTGVTWVDGDPNAKLDKDKPYGNKYTQVPTMDELEEHIANVYKYVQQNPEKTTPNMILSYGWNEHDEGGWLCPTLLVDENGDPILDKDGNTQANTERLKTLNKVLVRLRGDKAEFGNVQETFNPTASPKPIDEATGNFNIWFVIIPAVVVVLGAGAVIIILKKKETKKDESQQ